MMKNLILLFSIITLISGISEEVSAQTKNSPTGGQLGQEHYWYDGTTKRSIRINPNRIADFTPTAASQVKASGILPNGKVISPRNGGARIWEVPAIVAKNGIIQPVTIPRGDFSQIFHDGNSAENRMRALPGGVIVYLDPSWGPHQVSGWANKNGFFILKKLEINPNVFLIKSPPGIDSLLLANVLVEGGEVKYAIPNWWTPVSKR